MQRNTFFPYPGRGMGETVLNGPSKASLDAIGQQVIDRKQRIDFLESWGEPFWLPLALTIGTTPAVGTQFTRITSNVEFDLLVVGAISDLRLSSIQITDSSRQKALINAPTPMYFISQWVTTTATYTSTCTNKWQQPYYLAPRAQFNVQITADGTESNGNIVFICKMPPNYNA
jgi:hypothetical protein